MGEEIARQKGISLYRQVAAVLRGRIESNEWKQDDRLPSIEELSKEFAVAKVTVRHALQILESEGLVYSQQGKGSFVRSHKEKWLSLQGGWAPLVNVVELQKHAVKVFVSEVRFSCPTLPEYPCSFAPEYRFQIRVHYIKDAPYCYNHIYFDERIFRKNPELFSTKPIIVSMSQYVDHPIVTARQILTVRGADEQVAEYLGLPYGAPVVRANRIAIDSTGTAVFSSIVQYPGQHIKLDIDLAVY